MIRALLRGLTIFAATAFVALPGCKEEPTIVITFEPQDLSVRRDASRPADLAPSPDLAAPPGDPCHKDADCAIVKADCCGCAAGGKAAVIARTRVKGHDKELHGKCAGTVCAQMMSNDPSCAQLAACVAGRCQLKPRPKTK